MASTIQEFNGAVAATGDEVAGKYNGTLYAAEVTDIDTLTDTPILTINDDGIGAQSGWTFVNCEPGERELQADMSWFWKNQKH